MSKSDLLGKQDIGPGETDSVGGCIRFGFEPLLRRMTPKVLIYAKPLLADHDPNSIVVPWSVPGNYQVPLLGELL